MPRARARLPKLRQAPRRCLRRLRFRPCPRPAVERCAAASPTSRMRWPTRRLRSSPPWGKNRQAIDLDLGKKRINLIFDFLPVRSVKSRRRRRAAPRLEGHQPDELNELACFRLAKIGGTRCRGPDRVWNFCRKITVRLRATNERAVRQFAEGPGLRVPIPCLGYEETSPWPRRRDCRDALPGVRRRVAGRGRVRSLCRRSCPRCRDEVFGFAALQFRQGLDETYSRYSRRSARRFA